MGVCQRAWILTSILRNVPMKPNKFFSHDQETLIQPLLNMSKADTSKYAIHSCVIPSSWVQGDSVPGFEVPKGCLKARAFIHDVRLNPMNCELQALFKIYMVFGDENTKFEGWC